MARLVGSTTVTGTGATRTSPNVDFTGVNLIIFPYVCNWSGSPTFSDSEGNSYTSWGSVVVIPFTKGGFNYVINPTVSSSMNFTIGNGAANQSGIVAGFRCGLSTPTVDATSTMKAVNASSITQNSITAGGDNALILSLVAKFGDQTTSTIDSGFTEIEDISTSPGQWYGQTLAFLNQATPSAVAPTITVSGTTADLVGQQGSFLVGPDGRPISQGYIF